MRLIRLTPTTHEPTLEARRLNFEAIRDELTEKQFLILCAVKRHFEIQGNYPTYRELHRFMINLGIANYYAVTVSSRLSELRDLGFIVAKQHPVSRKLGSVNTLSTRALQLVTRCKP